MRWQPIETAPKDGTWVLLRGGRPWDEGDANPPMVVARLMPNECWPEDMEWQFAYFESAWRGEYLNPTEWMPLPEPPNRA